MMANALITATGATGGGGGGTLTASVSPNLVSRETRSGSWTSPLITCTAFGGTEPYSYSWSISEGDFLITDDTAQSTRVRTSGYNETIFGTITVTVTDADTNTAFASGDIEVTFL